MVNFRDADFKEKKISDQSNQTMHETIEIIANSDDAIILPPDGIKNFLPSNPRILNFFLVLKTRQFHPFLFHNIFYSYGYLERF